MEHSFNGKFDTVMTVGDCLEIELNGIIYQARTEYDPDSLPSDYDCYSKEDIEKWEREEWYYVGLVIGAKKEESGHTWTCENICSLWGIEMSICENNNHITEYANELLNEAIAELSK